MNRKILVRMGLLLQQKKKEKREERNWWACEEVIEEEFIDQCCGMAIKNVTTRIGRDKDWIMGIVCVWQVLGEDFASFNCETWEFRTKYMLLEIGWASQVFQEAYLCALCLISSTAHSIQKAQRTPLLLRHFDSRAIPTPRYPTEIPPNPQIHPNHPKWFPLQHLQMPEIFQWGLIISLVRGLNGKCAVFAMYK